MNSPEHSLERTSSRALRVTELFFIGLAVFGVVCLLSSVYFVWNGVTWYKLGGLVSVSTLNLLTAHLGLRSVRERRRALERTSDPALSFREASSKDQR